VFCEIVAGRAPASVVLEDDRFIALLDILPMQPGHTLVIPRRHAVRLDELGDEAAALFGFAARVGSLLRGGLGCDDVNLILNDGPAANQTVPHAHVHVIPRRRGDLGRLLGRLLLRPVQPALGGPPRAALDRVAAGLRSVARGS
jgi:diadenosine tetraphosphate (Ap4A) HIT family hydrolase